MNNYIQHYGVPGMRWGTRNNRRSSSWKRKYKDSSKTIGKNVESRYLDRAKKQKLNKLDRALSITHDYKGRKITTLATVAKVAAGYVVVSKVLPVVIYNAAWATGKVVSNTPL